MDFIFFFFQVCNGLDSFLYCMWELHVSRARRVDEKREDYDTAINYIELIIFFNRYSALYGSYDICCLSAFRTSQLSLAAATYFPFGEEGRREGGRWTKRELSRDVVEAGDNLVVKRVCPPIRAII